jgi:hypothetical protein
MRERYYRITINDVVDGEAPLMVPNTNDDPPQLVLRDVVGTFTLWGPDHICVIH